MIDETVIKEYLKRGYSQMQRRTDPTFDIDYSPVRNGDYHYLNLNIVVEKDIFPIEKNERGYDILVSLVLSILRQLQEVSSKEHVRSLSLRDIEFRDKSETEYAVYVIINIDKQKHELQD